MVHSETVPGTVLDTVLAPFEAQAFTMFGAPTTWGEVLGFVTGAVCVWLVARRNIWNWPVGIANGVFFLLLFYDYGLFADSALQILYIVMGAYGWWAWLHGGPGREELPVSRTTGRQWLLLAVAGVALTGLMTWVLDGFTSSQVPLADATTTALSLLATWGQTRKKLESWWLWIAADVIYIPLYQYKELTLTAILYVGFLTLCVIGLLNWRAEYRRATGPAAGPGGTPADGAPAPGAVTR